MPSTPHRCNALLHQIMQLNLTVPISKSISSISRTLLVAPTTAPSTHTDGTLDGSILVRSSRSIATHISKPDATCEGQRSSSALRHCGLFRSTKKITRYCSLGHMDKALQVFDEMPLKDTPSWNAMIKGCLQCGELQLAWDLFCATPERNVVSWTTIMDGLARCGRIAEAEELFLKMPHRDTAAWTSMISGCFSNGKVAEALELFEKMPQRNVITWTAVISGLDQNGRSWEALPLFQQMVSSGVRPTPVTYASLLTACCNSNDKRLGAQVHAMIVKSGTLLDTFVSTSLITFYAKCKRVESSRMILEESELRTVVPWTALITGYGSNGEYRCAVEAFCCMKREGVVRNQSTFTSVLNSCGELEDLEKGRAIHADAVKSGFGYDVFVGSSLTFVYSRCGVVDDMLVAFESMMERNIVSWNSVITGCAQNGCGLLAFRLYKDMVLDLVQPDGITFVGLLTACSHSKMVDMARYLFRLLRHDEALETRLEHYICMVDVLGRSGNLEDAEEFINSMPLEPDKAVWLSLLSTCRGHSNQLEMARQTAEKILDQEPKCSAAYTLLSNMYASDGQWDNVSLVRSMMSNRKVLKEPGNSELR